MPRYLTRKEKRIIKNLKGSLAIISGTLQRELSKRKIENVPISDEEMAQLSRTEYLIAFTLIRLEGFEELKRGAKNNAR